MQQGWIKVHRKIQDSDIWNDKPFNRGAAWIDILLLCNHEDRRIWFEGRLITVKRGQFITSIEKLSDRWGWNRKKTSNFLKILENEKMVSTNRSTHGTTVTVENYGFYQDCGSTDGTTNGTNEGQPRDTNKNDKNDKEEKKTKKASVYKAFNNSLRLTSVRPYPSISKVYREEDGHGRELNEELPFGDM